MHNNQNNNNNTKDLNLQNKHDFVILNTVAKIYVEFKFFFQEIGVFVDKILIRHYYFLSRTHSSFFTIGRLSCSADVDNFTVC